MKIGRLEVCRWGFALNEWRYPGIALMLTRFAGQPGLYGYMALSPRLKWSFWRNA